MELLSIALTVLFIVYLIKDNKNKRIVLNSSQRLSSLADLNKNTKFGRVSPIYYNNLSCASKRQLDHLYLRDYLMSLIDTNECFYRKIVETISNNRATYNKYIERTNQIQSTATEDFCKSLGFSLIKFQKYEDRLFKKRLLRKPQWNVVVHCRASYTSPRGRNHYWKQEKYSYEELKAVFDAVMAIKKARQSREYQIKSERAKLTPSMRYDIFKRDKNRCQICGATAQDGVKLHVDHIIPVSKGGKTIPSNLQTLCDRCNLGKSDKV